MQAGKAHVPFQLFKIQNTNRITNSNIGNTFHLSGLSVNFGSHVTSSYRPAMKLDGVWKNKPKTQDLPLQVMLLLMVLSHTRCYRLYAFDSIGMGGGSNLAVSRLEKHAWKVEMGVTLTCAKKECQFLWRSKRSTLILYLRVHCQALILHVMPSLMRSLKFVSILI